MNTDCTLILDAFWVDNKPFPTMQSPNSNYGQAFHDYYYGNARFLGWMDICQLKASIKKHHITNIILQNLDAFGKICDIIGEVKVCVGYNYKKFKVIHSVSKEKELTHCDPIYTTVEFGGWEFPEDGEIPFRARAYMEYLLKHTRVNSITTFTEKIKFTIFFNKHGKIEFTSEPNS